MKELLCIVCPTSCRLTVEEVGQELQVTGHGCKRGIAFARAEVTNPTRTLASTVRTTFPGRPVVPVRTAGEIPKGQLREAMEALAQIEISHPLARGDVLVENFLGTGCSLIATDDLKED